MTDNRKSGIALMAGSIGNMVTMAMHPMGGGGLTAGQLEHLAGMAAYAHSLAIVSLVLLVLGAAGLTRRLNGEDRLAFAGMVVFAFAAVAIFIAAAVSGFIVPTIMRHMMRDTAAVAPMWHVAIDSVFQINQAFAKIYTVAVSVAIVLWSMAGVRGGGIGNKMAVYGGVVGVLLVVLIGVGHLRMDVHGMAAVVVVQGVWFITVGWQMRGVDAARLLVKPS